MSTVLRLINGRARIYNPGSLAPESFALIPHTLLPTYIHLYSFLRLNPGLLSILINIY